MRVKNLNFAWLCAALLSVAAPAWVRAQQVDLNQFRPSERARDGFAVSTASDQGHLRFGGQLYFDYSDDPLAFVDGTGGTAQVVHQQLTGHMVLSFGLWSRLVVYAGIPFHVMVNEDSSDQFDMLAVPLPDGGGFGDMWFGARVRLLGTERDVFQLALQGTLNIGTASAFDANQTYRGMTDRTPRIGGQPEVITTFNAMNGRLRFSLNLGYNMRPNTVLGPINLGDEITYGFGAMYDFFRKRNALVLIFETFGRVGLSLETGSSKFAAKQESPLEMLLGLKYHHYKGLSGGVGGGAGVISAYGVPDFRVLAMFGYTMPDRSERKSERESAPELSAAEEPTKSTGTSKRKADEPILPPLVQAPADTDNDGVPDSKDRCPVKVGAADNFGCPSAAERDRDSDGVPDLTDNCPREAGSVENNGCKKVQLVQITDDKLDISDRIYFSNNNAAILPRSRGILDNIAAVMKAHPEIKKLRIDAHTDARGSDARNQKISQMRAQAVLKYLLRKGVKKPRLIARGFGETKPVIAGAKTADEHAQNRRVEFSIQR